MTEQLVVVMFILALLFVGGFIWICARAKARQFVRRGSIGGGSSNRHRADDDFWPASAASFGMGAGSLGGDFGGGSSSGGGCDSGGF